MHAALPTPLKHPRTTRHRSFPSIRHTIKRMAENGCTDTIRRRAENACTWAPASVAGGIVDVGGVVALVVTNAIN